jgi:hypothetical protein
VSVTATGRNVPEVVALEMKELPMLEWDFASAHVSPGSSVILGPIPVGKRQVSLWTERHCTVEGGATRSVEVFEDVLTPVAFTISCA